MKNNMWKKDGNYEHQPNTIDQIWSQLQQKDKWFAFQTDPIKQRNSKSSSNYNLTKKQITKN